MESLVDEQGFQVLTASECDAVMSSAAFVLLILCMVFITCCTVKAVKRYKERLKIAAAALPPVSQIELEIKRRRAEEQEQKEKEAKWAADRQALDVSSAACFHRPRASFTQCQRVYV